MVPSSRCGLGRGGLPAGDASGDVNTAATLTSLVFIMVTGAAVPLTDSGLGCSTWPSCEPDSFTPRFASDTHGMVEWVNRVITASVGLLTVAAVLGARARRPYRADLFRWSLGLPAWVFANGLVGALVVWLHLAPASVIGHFLLSLAAVWNAVVLYERAGEDLAEGSGRAGGQRALATAPGGGAGTPTPATSGPTGWTWSWATWCGSTASPWSCSWP